MSERLPGKKLPPHLQKLVDLLPLNVEVHRSQIEEAYGRTNYARRIRKIVSEYGWDIQRRRGPNGANDDWYMRTSDGPVREARIRKEVAPTIRRKIYARDGYVCQICGEPVGEGPEKTNPQCDHKVPAERGGDSDEANLMTLCVTCNLKKRQACKHCNWTSCEKCAFAFPEQFEQALILRLPEKTGAKLRNLSQRERLPPPVIIMRLIDQAE